MITMTADSEDVPDMRVFLLLPSVQDEVVCVPLV